MSTRLLAAVALALPLIAFSAPASGAAVAPMFSISNVTVVEGNSGMTMFTGSVQLMYLVGPLEIDLVAMPGTADVEDFVLPATHLSVRSDKPTTFTGYVVGDRRYEGDETFSIGGSSSTCSYCFTRPATITITDDDSDVAPHVSATAVKIPEGNAGWHTIQVPLLLDRVVDFDAAVIVRTAGGTPWTPTVTWGDYRPVNGMVTFPAGQTSAVVSVDVNGDTTWERDTAFSVELDAPRDVFVTTKTVSLTLVNDDAPAAVTIDDVRADEGQMGRHPVSLRATFDRPAPPFASVIVNVVGGTARAGEDFVGQSLELHPSPGATSVTFATMIISDTTPECDEGIVVEYRGVETGDEAMKEAKILVLDDDGPGGDAGTCPDPFATRSVPVEPAPDAAAPPPLEGGARPDAVAERPTAPAGGCTCGLAGNEGSRGAQLLGLGFLALAGLLGRVRPRR